MNFINLLIKDQVLHAYAFAGMTADKLPKKTGETILPIPEQGISIHITVAPTKSTYDKTLYRCEHVPTSARTDRLEALTILIRLRRDAPLDDALWEKIIRIEDYLINTLTEAIHA